jgi:ketosteroid isomerase-like protein
MTESRVVQWGDIRPTGRSVELQYIQVLRFRDGKHVSFNLMFDWYLARY